MPEVVEVVADRLVALIPSRVVYRQGVPRGTLPACYLVVRASTGATATGNMAGLPDAREPVVIVTSVARDDDAQQAGREAAWGAQAATDAILGWRPNLSGSLSTGRAEHLSSLPVTRDDDLPDVVMFAVEQFLFSYQPGVPADA